MPKNRRKDWAFCGVEKEFMALTLHATGAIPLSETICPKKRSRFWPNKHLAALIINPLRCRAQILAEDGLGVFRWRTKILKCHLYRPVFLKPWVAKPCKLPHVKEKNLRAQDLRSEEPS